MSYTTIVCLFAILLTQLFTVLLTTEIFKPRLLSSHTTRLLTRLTEFLPFVAYFVLPFYISKKIAWWKFLKWNVRGFAFSRILFRIHCCLYIVYRMSLACIFFFLSCLLLSVNFERVPCICYCSHYLSFNVERYYIVSIFVTIE